VAAPVALDVRHGERGSGHVLHTAAYVTRSREELGFAPTTGLAEGLDAELRWVLDRVQPRARAVSARPS
jgi:hypothetical protein